MKYYWFYWLDGKCERLEGMSPSNALMLAGYGAGGKDRGATAAKLCSRRKGRWTFAAQAG